MPDRPSHALSQYRVSRRVFAFTSLAIAALVPLLALRPAAACGCDVFIASFNRPAPDVDRAIWTTLTGPAGFIPRTALRNPASTPDGQGRVAVRKGGAALVLSRFNPTATVPGDSFWGSHIATRKTYFPPVSHYGVEFRVRLRVPQPLPPGIVAGVFLFAPTRDAASDFKSEIDFELLSNNLTRGSRPSILLNHYVDEPPSEGRPIAVPLPGLNLSRATDFTIRWFPHQQLIEWEVAGRVIHRASEHVPTTPMALHLNIWAPDPSFTTAYAASFQPARSAAQDMHHTVPIQAVRIRYIPVGHATR